MRSASRPLADDRWRHEESVAYLAPMNRWERDALGIGTLGEIKGAVETRMRIESASDSRAAWWISSLFGPDIWSYWRVGLLRPTLVGVSDRPLDPPEPLILKLPKHVASRVTPLAELDDYIAVCPAIIDEKALAFAVVGATEEEVEEGRIEPSDRWFLVAPSDLMTRLNLSDAGQVRVRLVPAGSYRAEAGHH
jgi:hypothetical protein